jgi:rhodanese-related sulfurtransferase
VALYVIDQGMDPANVYVLKDGLGAWQAAGYPMASGSD